MVYLCSCIRAMCVQYDAVYCNLRVGWGTVCAVLWIYHIEMGKNMYCTALYYEELNWIVLYCIVLDAMPCYAMPCYAMPCHAIEFLCMLKYLAIRKENTRKDQRAVQPVAGLISVWPTDRSVGTSKLGKLDPFSRPLGPCKPWSVLCLRADSLRFLFRIGGLRWNSLFALNSSIAILHYEWSLGVVVRIKGNVDSKKTY